MEGRLEIPVEITEAPYGYCQCGCGELTRIATKTIRSAGVQKGEPLRYIDRHQNRVNGRGRKVKGPDWISEDRGHHTECWIWQHGKDRLGYGKLGLKFNGRSFELAHRLAYEYYREPIPPEMTIDHLCRQPSCINPDHLEAVPQSVNASRAITATDPTLAAEIRALHRTGYMVADIQRAYGIKSPNTIHRIALGKSRARTNAFTGDVHALADKHGIRLGTHPRTRWSSR